MINICWLNACLSLFVKNVDLDEHYVGGAKSVFSYSPNVVFFHIFGQSELSLYYVDLIFVFWCIIF